MTDNVSTAARTNAPQTAVAGTGPGSGAGWWTRVDRRDATRTIAVAAAAGLVAVLEAAGVVWPVVVSVTVAGLLAGCWPILIEAWGDIRSRRMSMELSMLIAIAAAAAIGQWVTALVITAFVLAAEILEDLSLDRGRDALSDLMAVLPVTVQIREADRLVTVPLADVVAGKIVVVSPGGSIPVDGTVIAGRSEVDQSRITGESLPVEVESGSAVYAGSVNQIGAIEVRAEHVGADSSYGQVIETVRAAQASRAPAQRLADRLAAWLVYVALGAAVVTFLVTRDARATISVIVVAGACGIAAGTPLAVVAAIGRAARSGCYIKSGIHLEALSAVDTVVFDKTGTLTTGVVHVIDVRPAPGVDPSELIGAAAGAEFYSEHPIGRAIVRHATDLAIPVAPASTFDYQPGYGLTATVAGSEVRVGSTRLVPEAEHCDEALDDDVQASAVHVAIDGRYAGTIRLADTVRDSAAACVADLTGMGIRVAMVTGDAAGPARAIAEQSGVTDVRAGLLPADKVTAIRELRAVGRQVAMAGDGVNDAPALVEAHVGIAMGSGTVIARETADIELISSDLADLTETIRIARRARRIVMANFAGTIAVDLAGMTLAAIGILGPVLAAIVHVGSESAFILNSARLVPTRRTRR